VPRTFSVQRELPLERSLPLDACVASFLNCKTHVEIHDAILNEQRPRSSWRVRAHSGRAGPASVTKATTGIELM